MDQESLLVSRKLCEEFHSLGRVRDSPDAVARPRRSVRYSALSGPPQAYLNALCVVVLPKLVGALNGSLAEGVTD